MTPNRLLPLLVTATLVLTACVSQLSPSTFRVPPSQDHLADVQRALATHGLTVERMDPAVGIVETPWESTGSNSDGTIWATRYVITVAPEGEKARITVAMDLRTCEVGLGTNPHTGRLDASSCERLPPGTTPTMYQNRLDELAASLRAAMGGTAS